MPPGSGSSPPPNVRAVSRALDVLNSFAGKGLQSLAEVTAATGLDKGTTRRLLLTLMQKDFIAQDSVTNHYRLGGAIRELAANVQHAEDLRVIARPALLDLASDLGVTVFLSVFKDGAAVCLERLHDMRGIEVHWWAVGGALPLNTGGAPKLLLAYQTEAAIEAALDAPLTALNEESITDRATLRARLKTIRERGWECAVDDVMVGLTALAVPVLDRRGALVCAVSMAGLTPQMMQDGVPVHLARLQSAAARIEDALGG